MPDIEGPSDTGDTQITGGPQGGDDQTAHSLNDGNGSSGGGSNALLMSHSSKLNVSGDGDYGGSYLWPKDWTTVSDYIDANNVEQVKVVGARRHVPGTASADKATSIVSLGAEFALSSATAILGWAGAAASVAEAAYQIRQGDKAGAAITLALGAPNLIGLDLAGGVKHLDEVASVPEDPNMMLYRAVSPEKYIDISEKNGFRVEPGGSSFATGKQFGFELDEVLQFSDFAKETSGIVNITIPASVVRKIGDFTNVDTIIFENGIVTIPHDHLGEFNRAIIQIEDALK
ncbi:hypothetical protein [Asaia sp. VD9]|uniref:hypothetical protein n=1 Tax=Asaia sp. VD9 TaxID=3081235 RepID=UPI0030186F86